MREVGGNCVKRLKRGWNRKEGRGNKKFLKKWGGDGQAGSRGVYSFLVKGFNMGTKNLARLYVGVCKANKFSRNGGQPSIYCLCTLQLPYIKPELVPTGFTDLSISFDVLLESTKFLKMVYTLFLTNYKV